MSNLLQASTRPQKMIASLLTLIIALGPTVTPAFAASKPLKLGAIATPIQHLVVIFQESVSFDHYFGTYPSATNPPGEPKFKASTNTPVVNGYNKALLNFNPNLNPRSSGVAITRAWEVLPHAVFTVRRCLRNFSLLGGLDS